jgi:hypothetical protein
MQRTMLLIALAVLSNSVHAAERITSQTLIEEIKVQTQFHAWTLYKICLDGAAYYVIPTLTAPTGIAPVFNKDGKPELCKGNSVIK